MLRNIKRGRGGWGLSVSIVALSFSLCGMAYAVCPCELQDEGQLRAAYEKAQQEQLLEEAQAASNAAAASLPAVGRIARGAWQLNERQSQPGDGLSYWEIESGEAGIWWPLWETELFHQH